MISYNTNKINTGIFIFTEVRPITPPEERQKKQTRPPERKIIVGDTDLLLKHLFAGVVDDKKNPPALKRGRYVFIRLRN